MLRVMACSLLFLVPQENPGVLPADRDGRPLNLGFEDGTLKDWTAEGPAFEKQPVKGDTVSKRRKDMASRHEGEYWVGGFEHLGDAPHGTLTSALFKVTLNWASFLVAGGAHENTRVELVRADAQKVFFRISGDESEDLKPVVVDLREHAGKEIFIRIVDRQSGHWGHVNFDAFRFHELKPSFKNQRDPAKPVGLPLDEVKYAGLPPEEAARAMTLPPGFTATVFAAEPDVHQPIAFAIDDRGRLWVAENIGYPTWTPPENGGKDRIVIFEDTDGDGRHDRRKVFVDNLNFISGLEVGFGGAWVGAPPYLLFIPDKDGDDKPDGPAEILLDGWGHRDTHETLNAFTWGPDGWLYGCHGVFTYSSVGKPGVPEGERKYIDAGYWRYHPIKQEFEVFAEGCSNQWGIDFDANGQAFATACVIPHLYHVIQGARYQRQAGKHVNPHTYDDIKHIGNHVHWLGGAGPHGGNNKSDAAGGGHAHCGAMVYLGDNWPDEYRGRFFMNNVHGSRVNMDILERRGSGFVGRHGRDFMIANDRWSQCLNLKTGPDGAVYIIDWYDKQQCHTNKPGDHDRTNGRIYKIAHGKPKPAEIELAKLGGRELVELLLHRNDWYARHALRLLQERRRGEKVLTQLDEIAFTHADPSRNLRGLWGLHLTEGLTEERIARGLAHANEYVRAWTVQLACEDRKVPAALLAKFVTLAREDKSPVVRLYLASAAQRIPVEQRGDLLHALLQHAEDADDHNLPLLYWYAVEPVVGADLKRAATLMAACKIPLVRTFISRRMVAK